MSFLVIGLGNPGNKYIGTRHNAGFDAIDLFLEKYLKNNLPFKEQFKGLSKKVLYSGEEVFFLKPETFMNLSGESVVLFVNYFKINPENIIIVHDELDFDCGTVKIIQGGSSGGHNGIESIYQHVSGAKKSLRVRIGIGHPRRKIINDTPIKQSVSDYVLSRPFSDEINQYNAGVDLAAQAIGLIIKEGFIKAQKTVNTRIK